MRWGIVFSFIFIILVVVLLVLYWFIPLGTINYGIGSPDHSNFSLNALDSQGMQFYENMRYSDSKISYKIESCPLNKEAEMEQAFENSKTLIHVTCHRHKSEVPFGLIQLPKSTSFVRCTELGIRGGTQNKGFYEANAGLPQCDKDNHIYI